MRPTTLVLACVTVASGCAGPATPLSTNGASVGLVEEGAPQTPMRVRLDLISEHRGRLAVNAVVERRTKLRSPVLVRLEIPDGLSLVLGQKEFRVAADGQTGESSVRLEFTYVGAPPEGDLRIVADLGEAGFGVHATDAYRFGRPKAEMKRPERSGPAVKFGDKELGRAIPIQ